MLFRLLAKLFLAQGDKGIALLAQAEAGTASCYRRLLEPDRPNRICLHNRQVILGAIAKQEYAHVKQLQHFLGGVAKEELKKRWFDSRPDWTPKSAFTLGLSTYSSWRYLFGPSLFDMGEVDTFRTIAQIELLHGKFYRALAAASSGKARNLFLSIAADEEGHAQDLQDYLSDADRDRLWFRLPVAFALFWCFDWRKVKNRKVEEEMRWTPQQRN